MSFVQAPVASKRPMFLSIAHRLIALRNPCIVAGQLGPVVHDCWCAKYNCIMCFCFASRPYATYSRT
jgi:hypothetical protein